MKVCIVMKRLENEGWFLSRTRGSHRQFKHPTFPELVTVTGKSSRDLPIGTLHKIKKLARLRIN